MNDWLIVITAILIIAILADGVRRMHLSRRDKIRVSRKVYKQQTGREDAPTSTEVFTSELPNGGARVVSTHDPVISARPSVPARESRKNSRGFAENNVPPTLMEPVVEDVLMKGRHSEPAYEEEMPAARQAPVRHRRDEYEREEERYAPQERIEPGFFNEPETAPAPYADNRAPVRAEEAYDERDDYDDRYDDDEDDDRYEDDEPYDAEDDRYDDEQDEDDREYDYEDEEEEREEPVLAEDPNDPLTRAAPAKAVTEPEEVLIINIMAQRGDNFPGGELLEALLKAGLRFGDMNIFHRYSDIKGDGELLFSMANMVKPGYFDLEAMDDFETPGVSLFMTLPLKADSMKSFDLMVDTARDIADALGGELKDEQRSVMTRQTIDHCRERIRDFERRRLFSRQRRD